MERKCLTGERQSFEAAIFDLPGADDNFYGGKAFLRIGRTFGKLVFVKQKIGSSNLLSLFLIKSVDIIYLIKYISNIQKAQRPKFEDMLTINQLDPLRKVHCLHWPEVLPARKCLLREKGSLFQSACFGWGMCGFQGGKISQTERGLWKDHICLIN